MADDLVVGSANLELRGAVVRIVVSPSAGDAEYLHQSGLAVPRSDVVLALIDTGSAISFLAPSVVDASGAVERDEAEVTSTVQHADGFSRWFAPVHHATLSFIDAPFELQTLIARARVVHPEVKCVLGRDILSRCNFHYDGPSDLFRLALHPVGP